MVYPLTSRSPDVTCVVASRNRRGELLASLPRHQAPVVLVDNASTDGTVAAVRDAHPEIVVLALPRNEGALARTLGAAGVRTPFIAFTDDDSWWAAGDLARAVAIMHAHPRLALLNARILVGPDEHPDPVCTEMASSPLPTESDLPGPSLLGFMACAAVVRTEAFKQVGGFDPVVRFPGEEERLALDLAAAGWGLAYVEEVTVHHHPSSRRESPRRRQSGLWRSRTLTALMRYPWPDVGHHLRRAAAAGRPGWAGLASAVPRVPAALRRRRRLPDAVLAGVRQLAE